MKRFEWIDALRFLGILAIFIGHLGEGSGRLYSFVWAYHVPLMFFVSGLTFHSEGVSFSHYLKRVFSRIMIPYYFFMFLSLGITLLVIPTPVREAVVMLLKGLLAVKGIDFVQPLWFLPVLFLIQCLFFLLLRTLRKTWLVFLIAFIFYYLRSSVFAGFTSLWIPYCVDYVLTYLVFYAVGVCIAPFLLTLKRNKTCNLCALVLFLTGSIAYAFLFFSGRDLFAALSTIPALSFFTGFLRIILLIAANIPIAFFFSQVSPILRIGRTTLYMVGNEVIIKTIIPTALAMVGLSCNPSGELGAIIYCFTLLFLIERFIIPVEKPLLDMFIGTIHRRIENK